MYDYVRRSHAAILAKREFEVPPGNTGSAQRVAIFAANRFADA